MTPAHLARRSSRPLSTLSPSVAAIALITLLALPLPVFADALQDISKLIKQGQHSQALEQVDKFLASKPKDAQARFLKGIALTEMNKPNDAIVIFTKLTEDYPELPEPYNNLAVIYAQQKNYEKAKQSLEMAIRTHPSYATAHENLGDIYARLASQAYDKALQIDSSNSSAQNKLALIRDLMGSAGRPAKAGKPIEVASAPIAEPARPVEPVKPVTPTPPVAAPALPAATPSVAKPTETPKEIPRDASKASSSSANADITKAVDRWLSAWSRKEVKTYLSAYARDFKTPSGESRSAWESDRKRKIDKPGTINVSYDDLKVTVEGDTATVKFRQHYKSSGLKTSSNKVLVMVKRDNGWQIQQERVGH